MFISLTLFRILISFLRLCIHISSSFFYFFINIIFLKSIFIYTQVSLEFLRHLVIEIFFLFVCMYNIYIYKEKKKGWSKMRPLCIFFPKMSTYRSFDKNCVYFMIKEEKLKLYITNIM